MVHDVLLVALSVTLSLAIPAAWDRRYRIVRLFRSPKPSTGKATTTASFDEMVHSVFVRPLVAGEDGPRARQQRASAIVEEGLK